MAYAYTFILVARPDTSGLGNYGSYGYGINGNYGTSSSYGTSSNCGTNSDYGTNSSSDTSSKSQTNTNTETNTNSSTNSSLGADSNSLTNYYNSTSYGISGNLGPYSSSETKKEGSSLSSLSDGSQRPTSGKPQGKILMVVAPPRLSGTGTGYRRELLREPGFPLDVASKGTKHPAPMDEEASAPPRRNVEVMDLSEVKLSNYSAVVFVGGEGVNELKLYEDADYQNLAKSIVADGKVVGRAICLGPWILANVGLLEGKTATAVEVDYLHETGTNASDQSVVQDGKIVTDSWHSASKKFAEKVVSVLAEYS